MSSKKQSSVLTTVLTITFIICILCTLSITYLIYYKSSFTFKNTQNTFTNSSNTLKEPFDYFTCTMNLSDIDPKFSNNYMKFDGKSVKCGPCEGATLKINISNCHTDKKGNLSINCKPNALINSSQGNPIIFPSIITPNNLSNFFCIE
jgi:hypothetical protein